MFQITCEPAHTMEVRTALETAGVRVTSSDLTMVPTTLIDIDSVEGATAILRVIDALDDQDDVQEVYANFDISDEILAALDGS